MKFGRIPIRNAEGAVLGHSVAVTGGRFKKGRRVSREDVIALAAHGVHEVMAAVFEADDVPENEAAASLAEAIAGDNIRTADAFTGRSNLFSAARGLLVVDSGAVNRLNAVDESLTIATLPPYRMVEPGQMVATVKVIPFSVSNPAMDAYRKETANGPVLQVAPFAEHAAGLILTRIEGTKISILDKTALAVSTRLKALGSHLQAEIRCDHHEDAVAGAIREMLGKGLNPILILGASAIVDRGDVIPVAIERTGGTVDHFGMPVDPGNLLLLGHHGKTAVIGVPGCARSLRPNGFDWVLRRVVAGLSVTANDIRAMGVGGLLMEIPSRPQPREKRPETAMQRQPRIAAIILAAGQSRRMAGRHKLLADIGSQPMIAKIVDEACASDVSDVIVVTGHNAQGVREALAGRELTIVHNPDYADGISTSIKQGIAALRDIAEGMPDGVLICLGDMPAVASRHINRLIGAFNPLEGRSICVPTYKGKRGNPVLWASPLLEQFATLAGDAGAKYLIAQNEELVCEVAMDEDAVLVDIDTPAALDSFNARSTREE